MEEEEEALKYNYDFDDCYDDEDYDNDGYCVYLDEMIELLANNDAIVAKFRSE